MFLMSTKQITKIFFLIAIINIPLLLFYAQTTGHMEECGSDLQCIMEHIGIGAIGEMEGECNSTTKIKGGKMTFTC